MSVLERFGAPHAPALAPQNDISSPFVGEGPVMCRRAFLVKRPPTRPVPSCLLQELRVDSFVCLPYLEYSRLRSLSISRVQNLIVRAARTACCAYTLSRPQASACTFSVAAAPRLWCVAAPPFSAPHARTCTTANLIHPHWHFPALHCATAGAWQSPGRRHPLPAPADLFAPGSGSGAVRRAGCADPQMPTAGAGASPVQLGCCTQLEDALRVPVQGRGDWVLYAQTLPQVWGKRAGPGQQQQLLQGY